MKEEEDFPIKNSPFLNDLITARCKISNLDKKIEIQPENEELQE